MIKTSNRKKITYVPRYSFSFNKVTLAKATMTSIRGLKTEANNGPLICTTPEITTIIAPETTIPYITQFT
jgi:hypothetical protein